MAEGPTGPQTHLGCQREILVLGVIGASVYARNHHRQNRCRPGKWEPCVEERLRLMPALTLAYGSAQPNMCLG